MNKIITVLFVLTAGVCNAATGNASDGSLVAVAIIALVMLIAGTGYFIDLMKRKLKEFRIKRLSKKNSVDNESELLNPFTRAIHELDSITTY